jgi:hypothetical protein
MDEGGADDNLAVGFVTCQSLVELSCQSDTFLKGLVHFPVSSYNVLSHFLSVLMII